MKKMCWIFAILRTKSYKHENNYKKINDAS